MTLAGYRQAIPKDVETRVLVASKRRCCLCYYLHNTKGVTKGQIAHIDGDPSRSSFDDLAFLCHDHHDELDSSTRQSKGLQASEVRHYRDQLYRELASASSVVDAEAPAGPAKAVLEFSAPMCDDNVAIVDELNRPHTSVRLWRVELLNTVPDTEAVEVEVTSAGSLPRLPVLPVDLHRFHDDNPPFARRHDVRNKAPILFDVIAKHRDAEEFYLWRSDLPAPHYRFIYHLSAPEKGIILPSLHGDGLILKLRASANAPVRTVEQSYRLFLDGGNGLVMQ